jgi:hypothetical protein
MKSNPFDVSIPLLAVLSIVAAWQFYSLVTGGPTTGRSGVEIAAGAPTPSLRSTDPLGD